MPRCFFLLWGIFTTAHAICPFYTNTTCPAACDTCPASVTSARFCSQNSHTLITGASSIYDCVCDQGYYNTFTNSSFINCVVCPESFYCPLNSTSPTPCPPTVDDFSTSPVGSYDLSQCSCPPLSLKINGLCTHPSPGYFTNASQFSPCPPGYFCPGDGLAHACLRTSDCPALTAGVGLRCSNNSFFEPSITLIQYTTGPTQALVLLDRGFAWANATTLVVNGTKYFGSSTAGCGDGASPTFTNIRDIQPVGSTLWVADLGCQALRKLNLDTGVVITTLTNIGARDVTLLPNGFLLVTDFTHGEIWLVGPKTGTGHALMNMPLAVDTDVDLVVPVLYQIQAFVAQSNNQIQQILLNNLTILAQFNTTTTPTQVIAAGQFLLYTDTSALWQLTPGNTWINMLQANLGQRFFEPTNLTSLIHSAWDNSAAALLVGTSNRAYRVDMCHACPPNTTTPTDRPGLERCACAAGSFLNHSCQPCPAGSFCPFPSYTPTQCPEGSYCPLGASAPIPCDPSVFCAAGSIDSQGHTADSLNHTVCGPNFFGTLNCTRCPEGSGTAKPGATAISQCNCTTLTQNNVVLHTYLNTTLVQCLPCPATYFCSVGTTEPEPCPPGTYCQEGALTPSTCPAGFYCPGGLPDPVSCEAGTFCTTGSSAKGTCLATYFCPTEAQAMSPCPERSYCPTSSGEPTVCPAESFCPAQVQTPTGCPKGYFCPSNSSAPTKCPNSTSSNSNSGSMDQCYCLGNFYGLVNNCTECPVNSFSIPNSVNFSDCLCDTGYKLNSNETECIECSLGEYCPGGVASSCPAGYVCTSREALPCPAGKYCPPNTIEGTNPPIDCPPGGLCLEGSSDYSNCTAGFYCPGNTSVPIVCPGGFYCPVASPSPTSCPPGFQCAEGSTDATVECSAGLYCPGETDVGIVCPPANYCPSGASNATECPHSFYCPEGSAAPTLCPRSYFCPANSSEPTPCPPGHYCPAFVDAPEPCLADSYSGELAYVCTMCPDNSTTTVENATSIEECLCLPGFTGDYLFGCEPCFNNSYKTEPGNGSCLLCDQPTEPMATFCPEPPAIPTANTGSSSSMITYIAVGAGGGAALLGGALATWYSGVLSATHVIIPTAVAGGGRFSLESVKIL